MPQENVEILRKAIEAFNEGDIEGPIANLIAPEFEYIPTGSVPGMERVYRGPEGWRQFLEFFWSEFDQPRIEIRGLVASDEHVVAAQTFRGRGKQSGVEASWDLWNVWTLRDGKAVRGQAFTTESEALEAAGLSE
ncbi:MAG: nuclear transport factor 2 family protein [Actinomycetota bacterium]|nr:nuclear transport factor 2 family protein [Actinomycetota bacterium]